jgi:hypothetical protein
MSENNIVLSEPNELTLFENSVLVITYERGNMPPNKLKEYLKEIKTEMKEDFPNHKILAIPSNLKLSALHMVDSEAI